MNAKKIRLNSQFSVVALALLALTACDPFAKEKAEQAEKTRIECLDKICYGDVIPKFDNAKDAILKLNGQWYAGPKEYFSSGMNGGGFYWSSKHPMFKGGSYPERGQSVADAVIEIFLTGRQRWPTPNVEKPWEDRGWEAQFEKLEKNGLKISRQQVRPGLEVVTFIKADGKSYDTTFYIATKQRNIRGIELPGISCLSVTQTCTTGDFWQEDVYARLRFHIQHAQDWPAIHQEVIRVLNLAKKVQS